MSIKLPHVLISILAIFAPAQEMILSVLGLIAVDMITGIIAARKRGEAIDSAGLRRSISKLFVYEVALMAAFIAQHYLMKDTVQIASIIAGYVGLTETVSILENLNSIQGGDLLKKIIDQIGSKNQKAE